MGPPSVRTGRPSTASDERGCGHISLVRISSTGSGCADALAAPTRAHLRAAHDLFLTIGMEAFAERARNELVAAGERVSPQTARARDDLTPQERHIAGLAREGLSNPEIGAQLFLSPRTVEWHLRKVFTKLGIHSRQELLRALPSSYSKPMPA